MLKRKRSHGVWELPLIDTGGLASHSGASTCAGCLTAALLTGFLIIARCAQKAHSALFIHDFLKAPQTAFDRLAFLQFYLNLLISPTLHDLGCMVRGTPLRGMQKPIGRTRGGKYEKHGMLSSRESIKRSLSSLCRFIST
jgi:hypothetical protein